MLRFVGFLFLFLLFALWIIGALAAVADPNGFVGAFGEFLFLVASVIFGVLAVFRFGKFVGRKSSGGLHAWNELKPGKDYRALIGVTMQIDGKQYPCPEELRCRTGEKVIVRRYVHEEEIGCRVEDVPRIVEHVGNG